VSDYEFTLRFTLPAGFGPDAAAERLYARGCDDALIGIGHPGRVALDFSRHADCARLAILSAIADVRAAIPGATLVEVAPDLVGITDVANLVGCSRQNIRQLMIAGSSGAPAPAHEGTQLLWHLAPLLGWLVREKKYRVSAGLFETAEAAMLVNAAAGAVQLDLREQDEIRELLA
jgi:hypothetical protein